MTDSRQSSSVGNSKTELSPEQITFNEGNAWERRSTLEKWLIVIVILLFIAAVIFLVLFLVFYLEDDDKDSVVSDACTKPECIETAATISMSMNATVDPCKDFYMFACGGWKAKHPIPSDQNSISSAVQVHDFVTKTMRDLLQEWDENAITPIKQVRMLFRSCENIDAIDAEGKQPMLDLLATAGNDVFPTLAPNWKEDGLNLTYIMSLVGAVGGLGSSPLIHWGPNPDLRDNTHNLIAIIEPDLNLEERRYYLDDDNADDLERYQQLYVDIMTELGADPNTAKQDAQDVVNFEIKVANATAPPDEKRNLEKLYNKMTIGNLTARYPEFDWLGYLRGELVLLPNLNLTEDYDVMIIAEKYYDQIFPILSATPKKTVLNYVMWTIVYKHADLLNKPVRDQKSKFILEMKGIKRASERWEVCVDNANEVLKFAASRLYVDHVFSPEAKTMVEGMVDELVAVFKEMVHEADWLSDVTKQAALQKANAMTKKIGYLNAIKNDGVLAALTGPMNITEDSFFDNNIESLAYFRMLGIGQLQSVLDNARFSSVEVNAFYNPTSNGILFPAAFLNKPFFSLEYLDVVNYGRIGYVIGHEVTHGFDDSGSRFDAQGNMRPWWQEEDMDQFQSRGQCMVDQYGSITVSAVNMSINGRLTLGENIADNGGLKEAFRAYKKQAAEREEKEPKLPVLSYTQDQLFFLSYAQLYCSNSRDEHLEALISSDNHSPDRYRVIVPLQNNEDFARAFNCPVGSYMNPAKKCHVW